MWPNEIYSRRCEQPHPSAPSIAGVSLGGHICISSLHPSAPSILGASLGGCSLTAPSTSEWSIKSSAPLEVGHCLHSLCRSSRWRLALREVKGFYFIQRVVMTFAKLSLCVLLLLPFWNGVFGARMLSVRVQGELPSCKDVPGGVPNWDCYEPPLTPLPPCDFNHQNPGIDCSIDSQTAPPAPKPRLESEVSASGASTVTAHHGLQGMLPPCKDVPGGVRNWDCYDPPSTPLPPCDFNHQNPGIDCSVGVSD